MKRFKFIAAAVLGISMCVQANPSWANGVTASAEEIRAFIRHYEATSDYDRYYAGIRTSPPKRLTQMTVGEVMAWQASLKNVTSTAVGSYQIIKNTLRSLVRTHGIDRNARFDAAMQDRLADLLLLECREHFGSVNRYGNCIAGIWAAFPLLTGPKRGESQYEGYAGNKALTTPQNVIALLSNGRGEFTPLPAGGASVTAYRERIAQMQRELDAQRAAGQAVVFTTNTYENF